MNIRLMGTLEEIEITLSKMRKQFDIISQSEPYKNRGSGELYRVYLVVKLKDN